jgi:DNA repair exonuclease SbcCD ATPase subunit
MIGTYRLKLEREKGYLDTLIKRQNTYQQNLALVDKQLIDAEEALAFIQQVAKATQGQVKVHIEDIITMALDTIMDDPYKLELDFVLRRNKTECDIYFVRNGKRIKPIDESGGGAVDIASFASRIALWSLGSSDNVLVFDEPFKFVSKQYQSKVAELLTKLSDKLGLQIIMVSHNDNYIQQADKIIEVYKDKDTSKIKEIS